MASIVSMANITSSPSYYKFQFDMAGDAISWYSVHMDPYFGSMEFQFVATDGNVSLGGGSSQN